MGITDGGILRTRCGHGHSNGKRGVVMNIIDQLEDLFTACGIIDESGGCGKCPIRTTCLLTTTVEQFCFDTPKDNIKAFYGYADRCKGYVSAEDQIALEADMVRKDDVWQD